MKLSIKSKLLLGYGAVLVIVSFITIFTLTMLNRVDSTQSRITNLRQPTVVAGMNLSNGVNISLAGLRAYMILGSDKEKSAQFKAVRLQGWQLIDQSINTFEQRSKKWTDENNISRLTEMKYLIEEFRKAQQQIEDIAQHKSNNASQLKLHDTAKPEAQKAASALYEILRSMPQQGSKTSRRLLSQQQQGIYDSLVNLTSYVYNGSDINKNKLNELWADNISNYARLQKFAAITNHPEWQSFSQARQAYQQSWSEINQLRSQADWNKANYWLGTKAAPKAQAIQSLLKAMRKSQDRLMKIDNQKLNGDISSSITVLVIGVGFTLLLGIAIALVLSNRLVNHINTILLRTQDIAQGKLSSESLNINSGDELQQLGEATSLMTENLCQLIHQVKNSGHDLSDASAQLTGISRATNSSMDAQKKAIGEVEVAMTEMIGTVDNMAQSASKTADATRTADQEASEGQQIMEANMESIGHLTTRIATAAKTINLLQEDTKGVDEIVQVISDIAEQTNLLALNAAIEAARAGDQGRGFAVVADEVRTLAGRTQESTEQISSLLDRLKNGTQQAVKDMIEGQQQTEDSVSSAQQTQAALQNIIQSVKTINSMNLQIAAATEEQNSVAKNMSDSIHLIHTESTLALKNTRETDSSAQLMGKYADNLNQSIRKFQLPDR